MTIFILGGGPAGLSVVDGLTDSHHDTFILIEREGELGGLARTLHWEGIGRHDLGPHKLFTFDTQLMKRLISLLPKEDWLSQKKIAGVYSKNCLLRHPPSIRDLLRAFGLIGFAKLVSGFLIAKLRSAIFKTNPTDFESILKQRVGVPLYKAFLQPTAEKAWGNLSELDPQLAENRIHIPSLKEFIFKQLHLQRTSQSEALTFFYPKGGLDRLWDAIRMKAAVNGTFYTNHSLIKMDVDGKRISKIYCKNALDGKIQTFDVAEGDQVVSTLPLFVQNMLMPEILSDDEKSLLKNSLVLNDLFLVFLHFDTPALFKESWVFVPEKDYVIHRISEQKSFDPGMTPHGTIVCCEIMSHHEKYLSGLSEDELISRVTVDLRKIRGADFKVLNARVIKLPKSYPVYRRGYQAILAQILKKFDHLENFKTIGRQGSFNYIGILDAMDMGYGYVDWLAKNRLNWEDERKRTQNYPVLD